jgi:hypothetical protein
MKKLNFRIDFSPIKVQTIKNILHKDIMVIVVNYNGGMGGGTETIYCKLFNIKNELGFMTVKDAISGEVIEINPRYVSTIKKANITELYYEHDNSNYTSKKRTEWYVHSTDSEVEFSINNNLKTVVRGGDADIKLLQVENYLI